MALDADQIVERRRLNRKLVFWRIAAFLVLAIALVGVLAASGDGGFRQLLGGGSAHVARV